MSVNFKKNNNNIKDMKISAHTNVTNVIESGYPVLESIKSYANFCDEVIVVDGGSTDGSLEEIAKIPNVKIIQGNKWEKDFNWDIIARNAKIGLNACKNKWCIKFDVDYIFHEKWIDKIKEDLASCSLAAMELKKVNFVTCNKCYHKDNYPFAVNKGDFPSVTYGAGKDIGSSKYGSSFLRPIARTGTRRDGLDEGIFLKKDNVRLEEVA